MSGFLSMPWSLALSALRMKLATLRPGIAVGYWNARNMPRRARLSGLSLRMSRPRHMTSPPVTMYRGVAHQRVGERRLSRAVGAHDRVDLAGPDLEVDALEDLALRRGGGRDPQAADDERFGRRRSRRWWWRRSVWSVTMASGLLRGLGSRLVRAGARRSAGGTRSARVTPSSAPATASRTRIQRKLTVHDEVRAARVVGVVLGGADHRGERALERAEDLAHLDRLGRPRQLVAAVGAARARRPGRRPEGRRQAARGRPAACPRPRRSPRGWPARAEVPPELDHQPNAVLALRAEGDGARAVERGPMAGGGLIRGGQEGVLNPKRSCRD